MLTRGEVDAPTAELLIFGAEPVGTTGLGDCLTGNGDALGWRYVPELRRNFSRSR